MRLNSLGAPIDGSPAVDAPPAEIAIRRISLLHYAPAFVLLLIVVADCGMYPDPDLWGHLRFGQAALASGHVVTADTYSYSAANAVWLNHEWLTEIVMALAYNGLGVVGLKLWKFACVAATMVSIALAMAETGASPSIQLNLLALAALAMVPQNQFRPQLFTFMLFAAMLALLARDNYRGRAPLWIVVPVMALWGNLHGGFIVGIATLAIYTIVAGGQDLITGRGPRRALRLGLIMLAGTLATLISPYGIDAWRVVLNALRHYRAQPIIADWQPLLHAMAGQWRIDPPTVIFFVSGIAIMAAFVLTFVRAPQGPLPASEKARPSIDDLPLVAIALTMSVAAFAAVRNMPLAVIACMPPLAHHAQLIVERRHHRGLSQNPLATSALAPSRDDRSGTSSWLVIFIAIVVAIFAGLFSRRLVVDPHEYPIGAVAFMRMHGINGNILDDFGWGEYLIWHLEPQFKVFIDGRYDTVYPTKVIDQFLDFINARPDSLSILHAYPHDLVLIPAKAPVVPLMKSQRGWTLVYRDPVAVLFARSNSAAAQLPGVPIDGILPGESIFP
jgi:hypothetical protein